MNIMTKQDIKTGQVVADIVLTEKEVKKLVDGKIVTGDQPKLAVQIVGYGDESAKS